MSVFSEDMTGRFGCILADPPWAFETHSGETMTPHRCAEDHYQTMTLEQMAALPVGDIAALGTIVAGGGKHAAVAAFLAQHNTERGDRANPGHPADKPVSTITGRGTQQQLVQTTLIEAGELLADVMDRAVQVAAFLVKYYGSEIGQYQPVDQPLDTITVKPRFAVVTVTLEVAGDAVTFVLVDIGMRMLEPRELARAQGFPDGYILDPECWYRTDSGARKFGKLPKTHQIAKIGNSVCPGLAEALVRANLPEICAARAAA